MVAATRIELVDYFARKRLKPIYSAKHVKRKLPLEIYAYRSQEIYSYHEKHPRKVGMFHGSSDKD